MKHNSNDKENMGVSMITQTSNKNSSDLRQSGSKYFEEF